MTYACVEYVEQRRQRSLCKLLKLKAYSLLRCASKYLRYVRARETRRTHRT